MTIDEFIKRLEATPGEWKLRADGAIRLGYCCPITAVDGRGLDASDYTLCCQSLGISRVDAELIVTAADANYWWRHARWASEAPAMRYRLLAACRLVERQ